MLTVLSVAYPLAPVGPAPVGGAEQVLSLLDGALVRAGHRSIVVARAGSAVQGTLVPTPAGDGPLDAQTREDAALANRHAIDRALARWPVDVVHMHGIDFHRYLPPPGVPVLATLHLPPSWYPPEALRPERPGTYLHCVSASQHRACPPGTPLLPPMPNGVPLAASAARHARRRFTLALGRICPEKGFHVALDAARRAGVPLLLGGQVFRYEAHERYFRDEILPRLDRARRFIGPLAPVRKRRLLAAARCLLVPSLAPETSSLVAMEALAAGTPVIAFPNGALPEIVEHGRTGFLVRDEREMADAIRAVGVIDPEACRAAARERFPADRMVERYLAVYAELAAGRLRRPAAGVGIGVERGTDGGGDAAGTGSAEGAEAEQGQGQGAGNGPSLEVETLTSLAALEALAPEWEALWRRAPDATPFQAPQWLIPWWRHFPGAALRTLALRRAGELVGVAPLYLHREGGAGGAGRLLPLGIGNSDYLDPLLDPDCASAAARAIVDRLCADRWPLCADARRTPGNPHRRTEEGTGDRDRHRVDPNLACPHCDGWNVCELPQLRPGSPLLEAPDVPPRRTPTPPLLETPHASRRRAPTPLPLDTPTPPDANGDAGAGITAAEPCPVLALPPAVEDLPSVVPAGTLANVRYAERRAERMGGVTVEAATERNFAVLFDALVALHHARWADRGLPGVLGDVVVVRFHREAALALLSLGALRLYLLRIGGRPAAGCYGFLAKRRAYYYLGGFDPAFRQVGPGNLVVWHAIREAVREGAREFDFLRGREPYKFAWGAGDRPTWRWRLNRQPARPREGAPTPASKPVTADVQTGTGAGGADAIAAGGRGAGTSPSRDATVPDEPGPRAAGTRVRRGDDRPDPHAG